MVAKKSLCYDEKYVSLHEKSFSFVKKLVCMVNRPSLATESLLKEVFSCSSVDHLNESPSHTLTQSYCWKEMRARRQFFQSMNDPQLVFAIAEKIQAECGCASGIPCYWSSSPSQLRDVNDWILYTIRAPCLIQRIEIVPYRVFWYPMKPTYAPRQVSFSFFVRKVNEPLHDTVKTFGINAHLLYESPLYKVVSDMTLQAFHLPKPVFMEPANSFLRINLIGRSQGLAPIAQDIQIPNMDLNRFQNQAVFDPNYYICLTYVGACGVENPNL
uniref:Fbox protein putative n=1 Tax=Albugo laibachii Nc14 TaxID=890382 RepID=F0VZJ8_9STRA|nr:Fbox protein putative [Albugo laibachii Nc14]|eukprot:CCA14228.1 Fbox protein putative [Albugo laibachii Nc14]